MSDDEADPELVALLRAHFLGQPAAAAEPETGVLDGVEYVYDNAIDVALDMWSCKTAANSIYRQMQEKSYSTATWSEHELHPKSKDEATVNFIFTMDLLNFSFWSELPEDKRFAISYRGKTWTGYWSLVAALQRAIDEDIPITDPHFWQDENECTLEKLRHVFRSSTDEEIPLLERRLECLREAGKILYEKYSCRFTNCIDAANGSAAGLVNLLAEDFSCFRDEYRWKGRKKPIRFLKRAQILVADLWACFQGESYGAFRDIGKITMFADYRVPQILSTMGCISYSPPLMTAIKEKAMIQSGGTWEMQVRACSIWCVELIRREIKRNHPDVEINAILIDFFLYDLMKELEAKGQETLPHHRTRSIWY
ncbi:hypothetical protein M406DRAFT_60328 [Cryphonectria parasitica EP155]|uniref:Queuosine 5'-phosphate N-glycosylase/hydrolase n=1 Tax=Cryphonectria parasitica (strain ATCC 38755 / EP155) TaxID=660469 RepID=A0A9P4Y3B9_CRYP1|nr:uncharacterized protein M406DRAFT_60328 [Cryphonectria parasitica EP155]KAF3765685.1 hypothetical protein M406DRAFT_60328 [Cryphonectria parasitica EP155]